jgi:hypothetical protein
MDDTATSTNSSADANNSTTTTTNQYYYTYGSTLYLYGFLAMLSLIFLVSVAVAWQYVIILYDQNRSLTRFQYIEDVVIEGHCVPESTKPLPEAFMILDNPALIT